MKKILPILSVLCTWNAHALNDYGFYVGGDFTTSFWNAEVENDVTLKRTLSNPEYGSHTFENNVTDYSAELRLGSYLLWGEDDDFLTAVEFFAAPHNVNQNDEGNVYFPGDASYITVIQKTEVQYSFGGDLKQGMFFYDDWLAFVKAGIIFTQYNIITNLGLFPPPGGTLIPHAEDDFNLTGGRVGAGVEKFWGEHISTSLQAFYIFYEEFNTSYSQHNANGKVTNEITFKPDAIQLGLGVNFYF
jgi:hypothetical protein